MTADTDDGRLPRAAFRFTVALAERRDRDDWRTILAAIEQDPAAVAASRAEANAR